MTTTALPAALDFPAPPTTVEGAKVYLAWVADAALRGQIGRDQANGATKGIETWIKAENYAAQIRDLKRQVTDLLKATKARG